MKKLYTTTVVLYLTCTILLLTYLISVKVSITSLYNGQVITLNELKDQSLNKSLASVIFKSDTEVKFNKDSQVLFAYKTVLNDSLTSSQVEVESLDGKGAKGEWVIRFNKNFVPAKKDNGKIYEPKVIVRDKSPIYKVLLKSIFNPFNK
ncbi:hypothetical protein FFJ24_007865 [Pedobacter sp. KBS0701]|uniref:hypothetical protein n=1 Tax=Pedobacter sp. KBS0701 TaxID=2578106 RepID=UPI00110E63A6|nr:hypothetical protein [Pedobacter sp. KBS0701]QDW24734.1 hypothetical protein FFJ24_007865 [Pedobacter sp. KBS0701]